MCDISTIKSYFGPKYFGPKYPTPLCCVCCASLRCAMLCCAVQEEQAKRAARAKKFGLPEDRQAALQYAPDPEIQKRAARAKKFGSTYEQPSADTLLQKAGACRPVEWIARLQGCYLAPLELLRLPKLLIIITMAAGQAVASSRSAAVLDDFSVHRYLGKCSAVPCCQLYRASADCITDLLSPARML